MLIEQRIIKEEKEDTNFRVKEFLNFEGDEASLDKSNMMIAPYDVKLVKNYYRDIINKRDSLISKLVKIIIKLELSNLRK